MDSVGKRKATPNFSCLGFLTKFILLLGTLFLEYKRQKKRVSLHTFYTNKTKHLYLESHTQIQNKTYKQTKDDVDDFFATVPRVGLRSGVRIGGHVLRRGGFGFTFFFSFFSDDDDVGREEKARDAYFFGGGGERKARANERDEQRNAREIERSWIVEGRHPDHAARGATGCFERRRIETFFDFGCPTATPRRGAHLDENRLSSKGRTTTTILDD